MRHRDAEAGGRLGGDHARRCRIAKDGLLDEEHAPTLGVARHQMLRARKELVPTQVGQAHEIVSNVRWHAGGLPLPI